MSSALDKSTNVNLFVCSTLISIKTSVVLVLLINFWFFVVLSFGIFLCPAAVLDFISRSGLLQAETCWGSILVDLLF